MPRTEFSAAPTFSTDQAVGRRVHQLMWDRRITARSLAPELGLEASGLGRRLRGERGWSADEILCAANYFEVSTDYLFWRSDDDGDVGPAGIEPTTSTV